MIAILIWWLLISLFGIAALPITLKVFQFLPDRGYAFSKILGLLLVGLLSWLIGFVSFSSLTIVATFLLLTGFSYWLWVRYQDEIRTLLVERWAYIVVCELFFLALYFLFVWFRMQNPDIIGTEKFMDLAFLNSMSRATSMPPYDPWLSGANFSISYYYLGYLLMSILLRLAGTAPAIGFTLSLAMLYALAGVSVFGMLYNLTRRYGWAFGGWALIFLIGNLDGFKQVLATRTIENFNWWTPSRVIPDTINEFPFFSFLLGDMHPHMLSIPYVMLALGLALNHIKSTEREIELQQPLQLGRLLVWGLVIGALGFMNSWDLPTTFWLAGLAIFLQQYRQRQSLAAMPWKNILLALAIMLGMMIIPYIPFYASFHSQAKGIRWTTQNTRLGDFLLIYGVFVFLGLTFLVARYHQWFVALLARPEKSAAGERQRTPRFCPQCGVKLREGKAICGQCGNKITPLSLEAESSPLARPISDVPAWFREFIFFLLQPVAYFRQGGSKDAVSPIWLIAGSLGLAGLAMWLKMMFFSSANNPQPLMLGVTIMAIMAFGVLMLARADKIETTFALMLCLTAAGLVMGCDLLHIDDTFEPPLDRMNTVFKFYYQTWFLMGLAGVYGTYWAFEHSLRNANLRIIWGAGLVLLLSASMIYPYAAVLVKTNNFSTVPTLDGSAYLNNQFGPDRDGIEWLRHNIKGNPVVLEATGGEYTDFARVSSFTGLPTVLGWGGHELQWRGNYDEPARRIPAIDTMYGSPDANEAKRLVEEYKVDLVFVGTLERQKYPEPALAKFAQFMDKLYENEGGVVIYRRR